MNLLLTGGTGFVGSHVAAALSARDSHLRCTVRASSDTGWLEELGVERVELDLRDPAGVGAALEGVDVLVHVAGVTRAADEETFFRVNTEGTLSLAQAAVDAGVERFVFMSSLAARGPDPEGAEPGVEVKVSPRSPYGLSKLTAEERLLAFADRMRVVVLRPGGVYGPRDVDMLPLWRAASRGHLLLPVGAGPVQPVYAGDVAAAVVRAVEGEPGVGPFPVLEARRYTWDEAVDAMEAALGREIRVHRVSPRLFLAAGALVEEAFRVLGRPPPFDRRRARDVALHRWTADTGRAEAALGWRARVPLATGLGHTARWYREHGWI